MKKSILVLLALTMFAAIQAQTYTGDLVLTSQSAVNNCNYTKVTGDLAIVNSSTINDLSPLSSLDTVGGGIYIQSNSILTNLDGLNNVTTVGDGLTIHYNNQLHDYCGLYTLINGGGLSGDYAVWEYGDPFAPVAPYLTPNPTQQEIIDGCAPPVPLSNWAIYMGILLIAIFMFVGYRRRLLA